MFLGKIFSALSLLVLGIIFSSVCSAAPLMVEKNLFSTDRKAPAADSGDVAPKPPKQGMAIGNIQLDGVVFQNNSKKALLRMKNQPAGKPAAKGQYNSPFVTVQEGQTVSDYHVSKIEPKSISLEKDGQTFTIGLFAENKVVSPPSPAPAVAPTPAPGQPGAPVAPEAESQQNAASQPGVVQMQPNGFAAHPPIDGNVIRGNPRVPVPPNVPEGMAAPEQGQPIEAGEEE